MRHEINSQFTRSFKCLIRFIRLIALSQPGTLSRVPIDVPGLVRHLSADRSVHVAVNGMESTGHHFFHYSPI